MAGAALSLTQDEAEQRAALLEVQRYDIDGRPHRPRRRHRRALRLDDHLHLPRAGRRARSSTAAPTSSPRRSTASRSAPAAGGPHRADRPAPRTTSSWSSPCSPTRPTARACTRRVDPADGEVYVWMSFEPDEARHVWACFDQPDLKAPHAFTVTAPAAWTRGQQQRRPADRGASTTAPRAGPSPTPRRCRRTTRSCSPGRSTRSGARSTATTSASSPAGRWPRCSTATPTSCSR